MGVQDQGHIPSIADSSAARFSASCRFFSFQNYQNSHIFLVSKITSLIVYINVAVVLWAAVWLAKFQSALHMAVERLKERVPFSSFQCAYFEYAPFQAIFAMTRVCVWPEHKWWADICIKYRKKKWQSIRPQEELEMATCSYPLHINISSPLTFPSY